MMYPGKVSLSKVNWKAKSEYEFINNFKLLQQSFNKLGINKNIDIGKLVKCKYQDNLEFLQWFKKIFDSVYVAGKEYDPMFKRKDTLTTPGDMSRR
jgi:RP/EB family microtubule-associated protein